MSNRERKRDDRRKRKQRASAATDEAEPGTQPVVVVDAEAQPTDASADGIGEPARENAPLDLAAEAERLGVSKSELKNQRVREQLEPLENDERPLAVTIGAIVSALIALSIVGAWVAGAEVGVYSDGIEVGSRRPGAFQVFPPAILFGVMAWGMWGKHYWAVLGLQAVLAIFMVGAFLFIVAATSLIQAATGIFVLLAAGTLFWFMIKALARIQMPEGPT